VFQLKADEAATRREPSAAAVVGHLWSRETPSARLAGSLEKVCLGGRGTFLLPLVQYSRTDSQSLSLQSTRACQVLYTGGGGDAGQDAL
jgi:hypothetical protein